MSFSEGNNVSRPNNKQLGSASSKYRPSFSKLLVMVVIIIYSSLTISRLDTLKQLLPTNNNHGDVLQQQRYANREEGMVESYTDSDVEQTDYLNSAALTSINKTINSSSTISATLPSCKTLMQQQSEYASGEFLTSTPVNWTLRVDGSREVKLTKICHLHRYTANEARKCLANTYIMMIGDSITRYQMLSLAYFLHVGRYPKRFGWVKGLDSTKANSTNDRTHVNEKGEEECSDGPNICIEKDFEQKNGPSEFDGAGWEWFHHIIGGGNDGGPPFDGHLECACA